MEADNSTGVIELRIREVAQLFNSLDPSPFRERDLDVAAEEHIVGWASELPEDVALRILIHLPENEVKKAEDLGLPAAISNYFAVRAETTQRDLRELFRNGRRYIAIGVPVLLICLVASQLVHNALGTSPFGRSLEESLVIVGWVANWKPIETFLYDWWPLKRRRHLYQRLEGATVVITTS